MRISFTSKGDWSKTTKFLEKASSNSVYSDLHKYGKMGVEALAAATPVDTSLTANSWDYRIVRDRRGAGIEWFNTNRAGGTNVAILIQYGHATGTGGYVHGIDFINPAMRPIFEQIADGVWKKVTT